MLAAMNLQTSFLTPPFGWSLFYLKGVAPPQVTTGDIYRSVLPYIGIQAFGLVLVSMHMLASSRWKIELFSTLPPGALQNLLAVLVGGLSALLGIGGGTLMVPLLTLFAFPIHRAVSTASVFGLIISVPATMIYIVNGWDVSGLPQFSTGYVNWVAFAILVPMTMWFAPLGVKLAYRLNVPQLKGVFAVFLCIIGIKMVLA